MGIIGKNGSEATPQRRVLCRVGDRITFLIRGTEITKDGYKSSVFGGRESSDIGMEDIISRVNTFRANADDALVVGEIFMIGRTLWQVQSRSGGRFGAWTEGEPDVQVELEMIETTTNDSASAIGIAGRRATGGDGNNIQMWDGFRASGDNDGWLGPAFWPLVRCSFANIKNTREVDCTSWNPLWVGIRPMGFATSAACCNRRRWLIWRRVTHSTAASNRVRAHCSSRSTCGRLACRMTPNGLGRSWRNLLRHRLAARPVQLHPLIKRAAKADEFGTPGRLHIQFYVSDDEPSEVERQDRPGGRPGLFHQLRRLARHHGWKIVTARSKENQEMIQNEKDGSQRVKNLCCLWIRSA